MAETTKEQDEGFTANMRAVVTQMDALMAMMTDIMPVAQAGHFPPGRINDLLDYIDGKVAGIAQTVNDGVHDDTRICGCATCREAGAIAAKYYGELREKYCTSFLAQFAGILFEMSIMEVATECDTAFKVRPDIFGATTQEGMNAGAAVMHVLASVAAHSSFGVAQTVFVMDPPKEAVDVLEKINMGRFQSVVN